MKTLSIRNPISYLVVSGAKSVENRSWKTDYRGRIAIHSSGNLDHFGISAEHLPDAVTEYYADDPPPDDQSYESMLAFADSCDQTAGAVARLYALQQVHYGLMHGMQDAAECKTSAKAHGCYCICGAVIGDVELVDVVEGYDSIWSADTRYQWILESPRMYTRPIVNVLGKLRLFDIDIDVPEEYYDLRHSIDRRQS
jgi:hypothetical protein